MTAPVAVPGPSGSQPVPPPPVPAEPSGSARPLLLSITAYLLMGASAAWASARGSSPALPLPPAGLRQVLAPGAGPQDQAPDEAPPDEAPPEDASPED